MDKAILSALEKGSKRHAPPKPLKEFHAKEQSDGKYHVMRHSGKPNEPAQEHSAADLDEVHDAMEEHLGGPMTDEELGDHAPLGAGQPGMGGQE